jgi:hypothetical protein
MNEMTNHHHFSKEFLKERNREKGIQQSEQIHEKESMFQDNSEE